MIWIMVGSVLIGMNLFILLVHVVSGKPGWAVFTLAVITILGWTVRVDWRRLKNG